MLREIQNVAVSHLISDLGKSSEELSFESNEADTEEDYTSDPKQSLEDVLNGTESVKLNGSDEQIIKELIKEHVPKASKAGNEKMVAFGHIIAQKCVH